MRGRFACALVVRARARTGRESITGSTARCGPWPGPTPADKPSASADLRLWSQSAASPHGWMDAIRLRLGGRIRGWMDGWMDGWVDVSDTRVRATAQLRVHVGPRMNHRRAHASMRPFVLPDLRASEGVPVEHAAGCRARGAVRALSSDRAPGKNGTRVHYVEEGKSCPPCRALQLAIGQMAGLTGRIFFFGCCSAMNGVGVSPSPMSGCATPALDTMPRSARSSLFLCRRRRRTLHQPPGKNGTRSRVMCEGTKVLSGPTLCVPVQYRRGHENECERLR
ncbi:hypothetical protein DAEQUDRAFT_152470 [Daedalea quercina L-15889]|uniref:Uncharacterized protein n=1 Tax=Daedalea quercina L-15889 TaxID=1314783 RepID=A0A165RLW3_9APHY|nr:hypothetical protein DAEQUDRAFT_152470 [Daedalea quercina L-15889]